MVNKVFKMTSGSDYVLSLFFKVSCRSRLKAHENKVTICSGGHNFSHIVRGVRGTPFEAGFSNSVNRVRKGLKVKYVSSGRPRPLLIHSRLNGFTVAAIKGVGGVSRLVTGYFGGKYARFLRVDKKDMGPARVMTTLVGRGSGVVRKVHCTRRIVRNSVAVLVLAPGKVLTTHSHLKEAPLVIKGGRSTYYMSFRDFTCLGLKCRSLGRLNPKRVITIAPSNIRALRGPKRRVQVYSFL